MTVEGLDDPGLGDESFAVHVTFETSEDGPAGGEYVFVRSGDVLMLTAYLGTEAADFAVLAGPIDTTTARLQDVAAELGSE